QVAEVRNTRQEGGLAVLDQVARALLGVRQELPQGHAPDWFFDRHGAISPGENGQRRSARGTADDTGGAGGGVWECESCSFNPSRPGRRRNLPPGPVRQVGADWPLPVSALIVYIHPQAKRRQALSVFFPGGGL